MRTLQVINVQWYNATAWYAVHLARTLNNAGHPSIIVGIKDSLPLLHAKKLGLDVYELPLNSMKPKDVWACNIGINKICESFKPDIVNCHRGASFLLWVLKKIKYKYKLIRTRGDQRLPSANIFNRVLCKFFTDAIISTNTKMTNYFASHLHIPQKKLYTVLGGVDTNNFYPSNVDREAMRLQYKFTENDVVIGIIGRLDPVKGHKEIISVFADVCKQENDTQDNCTSIDACDKQNCEENQKQNSATNINSVIEPNITADISPNIVSSAAPVVSLNTKLHLAIVGGDCDYTIEDLRTLGRELEIPQENLHCIGYVADMHKLMCMLDMGLIASVSSETIARVAFEMIACHVPVMGSNVGVMPDILDEKYLYEPYDYAQMQKLLLMCKNPVFRNELLDLCVQRFEANHSFYGWSLDKFMEKTLTIYRDC